AQQPAQHAVLPSKEGIGFNHLLLLGPASYMQNWLIAFGKQNSLSSLPPRTALVTIGGLQLPSLAHRHNVCADVVAIHREYMFA
ncbi:MAG: hypothetical protein M3R24_35130, partial [Chloroflexota bacterium]|nr:hypothetical protein [Chloroflexota bacterium]